MAAAQYTRYITNTSSSTSQFTKKKNSEENMAACRLLVVVYLRAGICLRERTLVLGTVAFVNPSGY
jgi:hypothetical protein